MCRYTTKESQQRTLVYIVLILYCAGGIAFSQKATVTCDVSSGLISNMSGSISSTTTSQTQSCYWQFPVINYEVLFITVNSMNLARRTGTSFCNGTLPACNCTDHLTLLSDDTANKFYLCGQIKSKMCFVLKPKIKPEPIDLEKHQNCDLPIMLTTNTKRYLIWFYSATHHSDGFRLNYQRVNISDLKPGQSFSSQKPAVTTSQSTSEESEDQKLTTTATTTSIPQKTSDNQLTIIASAGGAVGIAVIIFVICILRRKHGRKTKTVGTLPEGKSKEPQQTPRTASQHNIVMSDLDQEDGEMYAVVHKPNLVDLPHEVSHSRNEHDTVHQGQQEATGSESLQVDNILYGGSESVHVDNVLYAGMK